MDLDIFNWKIKFYELFERNCQVVGEPIHEYALVQKFLGEGYDKLTNEDKKQCLKLMLDKFYNDLCRELGLD